MISSEALLAERRCIEPLKAAAKVILVSSICAAKRTCRWVSSLR